MVQTQQAQIRISLLASLTPNHLQIFTLYYHHLVALVTVRQCAVSKNAVAVQFKVACLFVLCTYHPITVCLFLTKSQTREQA